MGKFIDRVMLGVAVFILAFVTTISIFNNAILSLVIATFISCIVMLCTLHIANEKGDKTITLRKFDTYLIVKGLDYQLELLCKLYTNYEKFDKYIGNEHAIIMPIIKFSAINRDDIIKAYNIAKHHKTKDIYIISNNMDRVAISFSAYLSDISFQFVKSKELYKLAKEQKLLPTMPDNIKRPHRNISDLLGTLFRRENAGRFLFTSAILFLTAFITPLRTYYFIMSAVSAVLSIISLMCQGSISPASKLPNKK